MALRNIIVAYTDSTVQHTAWDEHLGTFQLAYNSSSHSENGFSPFFLVHGREARLPATPHTEPSTVSPVDYKNRLLLAILNAQRIVQMKNTNTQIRTALQANALRKKPLSDNTTLENVNAHRLKVYYE